MGFLPIFWGFWTPETCVIFDQKPQNPDSGVFFKKTPTEPSFWPQKPPKTPFLGFGTPVSTPIFANLQIFCKNLQKIGHFLTKSQKRGWSLGWLRHPRVTPHFLTLKVKKFLAKKVKNDLFGQKAFWVHFFGQKVHLFGLSAKKALKNRGGDWGLFDFVKKTTLVGQKSPIFGQILPLFGG